MPRTLRLGRMLAHGSGVGSHAGVAVRKVLLRRRRARPMKVQPECGARGACSWPHASVILAITPVTKHGVTKAEWQLSLPQHSTAGFADKARLNFGPGAFVAHAGL